MGFQRGPNNQSSPLSNPGGPVQVQAPPPARILQSGTVLGGTDITNATQTVIVGQWIDLTCVPPPGISVSSETWTLSGTYVGGFDPNTLQQGINVPTVSMPATSGRRTTLYFTDSGTGVNLTYTVNGTFVARTTFNILSSNQVGLLSTSLLWI